MSVIQVKKPLTKLFVLLLLALFIALPLFALLPPKTEAQPENNWAIDGTKVYIDDSRVYLEADPHTIASPGWVTFTLQSKLYTGDIDVVWGFDTTTVKPSKAEIYKLYLSNWTTNSSETFYYVSSFVLAPPSATCDYGFSYDAKHYQVNHAVPQYDEWGNLTGWQPTTSIVCFDNYTKNSVNYTVTWHEEHSQYIEWQPFTGDFTTINQEHGGMNTWYVLKNVPVEAGKEYIVRAWVDVPISTEGVSGKYWWCIKPSALSLTEAIAQDKFYALDPWYNVAYSYRKTVRITNPTAETLMNFPVFINVSYEPEMQNDFDDVTFTSLSNSLLLFELDDYVDSTYALYWLNETILASSYVDVYMYYGNPGASSLQNPEGVWDSHYVMVQHMNDYDTSHIHDSTHYGNHGTKLGANEPAECEGAVGKAQVFDGSNDYVLVSNSASINPVAAITVEAFVNTPASPIQAAIFEKMGALKGYSFFTTTHPVFRLSGGNGAATNALTPPSSIFPKSQWVHIVAVYDDANDIGITYINGAFDKSAATSATVMASTTNLYLGYSPFMLGTYTNDTLDEVRISNVARSADCILSSYEFVVNQSTYVTFSGGETCPCPPTIDSDSGNFWVNFTFTPDNTGCPLITDGYNVSWDNGTDNGWINTTSNYINLSLSPHECMNLTVWSWNATENVSSCDYAIAYACIPNNAPIISGGDNIFFNTSVVLLDLNYTDADGDICTFSTDCPYGSLNPITGEFIWNITGSEAGVPSANFTVNDSYGGSDMCVASFMDIFLYLQTLNLVEEQDMLAQMWLFLVLLLIDFALIFFVFFEIRDIFYGDGTVTIASILASLLSVVLSFILSFQSLLTPVEMPALNYFMLAVAMVMSIIFIRFIIQVIAMSLYAMRAKNF